MKEHAPQNETDRPTGKARTCSRVDPWGCMKVDCVIIFVEGSQLRSLRTILRESLASVNMGQINRESQDRLTPHMDRDMLADCHNPTIKLPPHPANEAH